MVGESTLSSSYHDESRISVTCELKINFSLYPVCLPLQGKCAVFPYYNFLMDTIVDLNSTAHLHFSKNYFSCLAYRQYCSISVKDCAVEDMESSFLD